MDRGTSNERWSRPRSTRAHWAHLWVRLIRIRIDGAEIESTIDGHRRRQLRSRWGARRVSVARKDAQAPHLGSRAGHALLAMKASTREASRSRGLRVLSFDRHAMGAHRSGRDTAALSSRHAQESGRGRSSGGTLHTGRIRAEREVVRGRWAAGMKRRRIGEAIEREWSRRSGGHGRVHDDVKCSRSSSERGGCGMRGGAGYVQRIQRHE